MRIRLAIIISALLFVGYGVSQGDSSVDAGTAAADAAAGASSALGGHAEDHGAERALASVGLVGGLPSYQTAALALSVQQRSVGFALRAGYGSGGVAGSASLRGYPPLQSPVPVYGAVGAAFGGGTALFGALGAHVPLDPNLRLDLEGGAAWLTGSEGGNWGPHLALGISYVFSFEPGERAPGERSSQGRDAACGAPTEESLRSALASTVERTLADLRAAYGASYRDVEYDYEITHLEISGDTGDVAIRYRGEATAVASGERESASGTASARYRWSGCLWVERMVRF